ncbi:MAG: hypothetical protein J6N76_06110, partial [Lachnospiraceae bacterium]|nr:hypothetical protein [Lachnospiraceae bacterium]
NMKIVERAGIYDESKNYDEEIIDIKAYIKNTGSVYAADNEKKEVPFSNGVKLLVPSESNLIENKLCRKLSSLVREIEYTKYRSDALKHVTEGEGVTKEYLETRRNKEALRLQYQKKRAGELEGFLRALRKDKGLLKKLSDKNVNDLSENELHFKAIYSNELKNEAEVDQEKFLLDDYNKILSIRVKDNLEKNMPKPEAQNAKEEKDKLSPWSYTIVKSKVEAARQAIKDTRKDRIWLNQYAIYQEMLDKEKTEWSRERALIKRKNIFYSHIGKGEKTFDEAAQRKKVWDEVKNKYYSKPKDPMAIKAEGHIPTVMERVEADEKKLQTSIYGDNEERWDKLTEDEKKQVFCNYFSIDKDDFTDDDPVVDEEGFQIVLYSIYPNEYREWAKYQKYHNNTVYVNEDNKKEAWDRASGIIQSKAIYNLINDNFDETFFGKVRRDIIRMRDAHFNVKVDKSKTIITNVDEIREGKGIWGRSIQRRLAEMQEEVLTGEQKSREERELAERIELMTPEYKENAAKVKDNIEL